MSDHCEILVDVDVSLDDAEQVRDNVIAELIRLGLIEPNLNAKCVLGGLGHPVGPNVQLYIRDSEELQFWTLQTSGVEPTVGYHFNELGLGESCEGFRCPACTNSFTSDHSAFLDRLGEAFENWYKSHTPTAMVCPACNASNLLEIWDCKPPLGFGNLSFRFWNWLPFDRSGWMIDIPDLIAMLTGHRFVLTYAHI